jgi:hypothetical protein
MVSWAAFNGFSVREKVNTLYELGTFIVSIRYYGYKVNLYQLGKEYIEVFIKHKDSSIEKIVRLDTQHSRMNFYCDQIKINTKK